MSTSRTSHFARSFVLFLAAALVLAGAGFAAARTVGGPPWALPLSGGSCDPAGTTVTVSLPATDDATQVDASESESSVDCPPAAGDDSAKQADEAQASFDSFGQCGSAVLGDAKLTGSAADPARAEAFASLAVALDSGQVDHMVQSVRVLLQNCAADPNEGLANALYHHGLNWARHYQHELWLEQRFADKWPNGKPGGGHDAGHESGSKTHGKPEKGDKSEEAHGNPHEADPSWAPGGGSSNGHGNANGHSA